jgi:hypothetical protein
VGFEADILALSERVGICLRTPILITVRPKIATEVNLERFIPVLATTQKKISRLIMLYIYRRISSFFLFV